LKLKIRCEMGIILEDVKREVDVDGALLVDRD
jgi:hypothetical protein